MRLLIATLFAGAALWCLPAVGATPRPPDALITSKTKLVLLTTAGVKSSNVHVDTADGVVTMYGKVSSAAQRELAERAAIEVQGVKSVKNLLQVVPAREDDVARSDRELHDAAEGVLNGPEFKASHLKVKSVDNGVVLLAGTAGSIDEYLRALAQIDRLPGVTHVASEVKTPDELRSGDAPSDGRISTEVKLRLLAAPRVPSTDLSVDTDDGVVTLFGTVPTADAKRAAEDEAEGVSGVQRVENHLEVVPAPIKQAVAARDEQIAKDLERALKGLPEHRRVSVEVKNGTVRLKGTVANAWEQLDAVRTARRVAGVRAIDNQLKVE